MTIADLLGRVKVDVKFLDKTVARIKRCLGFGNLAVDLVKYRLTARHVAGGACSRFSEAFEVGGSLSHGGIHRNEDTSM